MCKDQGTYIPNALLDRPDLLLAECAQVVEQRINWRGRLRQLTPEYGISGGSAGDRREIVQFMAALETRRLETGSLQ